MPRLNRSSWPSNGWARPYLAWLGLQALIGSFRVSEVRPQRSAMARNAYRDGLIVGLSNPKAMLFFVALVPQFVAPNGAALPQIVILAATGVVVDFSINAGYALAAGAFRRAFADSRMRKWVDRGVGGMFLSLAAATALYRRAA